MHPPDWLSQIDPEVFTIAVDKISPPDDEYVVWVSTLQRLNDLCKKYNLPMLIVGGKLAVVIFPSAKPVRFVWKGW